MKKPTALPRPRSAAGHATAEAAFRDIKRVRDRLLKTDRRAAAPLTLALQLLRREERP